MSIVKSPSRAPVHDMIGLASYGLYRGTGGATGGKHAHMWTPIARARAAQPLSSDLLPLGRGFPCSLQCPKKAIQLQIPTIPRAGVPTTQHVHPHVAHGHKLQ